jgi:hypothetical protein
MTIEPSALTEPAQAPQQILFSPGPRIGWTFRSHRDLIPAFPEPAPDPGSIREQAAARAAGEQRRWERARKWALRPSLIVLVALVALAGCAHAINPAAPLGTTVITAVVLAGPGTGWAIYRFLQLRMAQTTDPRHLYELARAGWAERAAIHEHTELAKVAHIPEWGSAIPSSRRVDVFGGTLEGWQSLAIVHGASLMAERPVLVADLTGQNVAAGLAAAARDAGAPAGEFLLPADLDRCGLLAALSPGQLAEAIHAGAPGGARADRAVDVRVLEQLCQALSGSRITPARLAAAVDAALGREARPGVLTEEETSLIGGKLFGESLLPQISSNLIRVDAFLSDLARHAPVGTPAPSQAAWCTIFTTEPGRSARTEVIAAILIQWLTVTTAAAVGSGTVPAVIVAGADEITRHHLEALADACDRAQAPLTMLFRHLRDDATTLIGGAATAFMRLGNHHEAEQAAAFIGRGHKFVLSGHTTSRGGDRTRTTGTTRTRGTSETRGWNSSRGWSENHGYSGDGYQSGVTESGGRGTSRDYSKSYSYGTEESVSEGTNWSQGTTTERVYEYTVEPTVLQNLPDNALLLLNRDASTSLQPVDCHPGIVTIPSLTTDPHGPAPATPPAPAAAPADVAPQADQPALAPPRAEPRWPAAPRDPQPRYARPPRRKPPTTPWWERNDPLR